jgi:hypothetical protein
MLGLEAEVRETLANPDEIQVSRSDPNVYLFYKLQREKRWVCAVAKKAGRGGFLITAYPTDAIKEGRSLWPK